MKLQTNLLGYLGLAAEKAIPEAGDTDLEVPNTVQPVALLRAPVTILVFPVGSAALPYKSSFMTSRSNLKGASTGAESTTLATIGKGYWYIYSSLTINSSVTAAGGAVGEVLRLFNPKSNTSVGLIHLWEIASVAVAYYYDSILIPDDGWQFIHDSSATGVGETKAEAVTLVCSRLVA